MPIEVNCPDCQALLRIADENAGRQTRCPSCSAVFTPSQPITPDGLSSAADPSPTPFAPASNPYAPSVAAPALHQETSSDWAPRQITADEVFSKAWAIFKEQWLMACVAVLIVWAINLGMNMAQNVMVRVLPDITNEPMVVFAAQVVLGVGIWLIQIWLQIGQTMVMLDIARGRQINVSKLFAGGPFLANTVLAIIMIALMVGTIGLVLIGIPAAVFGLAMQEVRAAVFAGVVGAMIALVPIVIVSLMFSQIQLLIVDRKIGAVDSLRTSYQITNGNKFTIFAIGMLIMVMGFCAFVVGLLALCIGVFPAMIAFGGFGSLLLVVAYLSMTGQQMVAPRSFVSPGPAT